MAGSSAQGNYRRWGRRTCSMAVGKCQTELPFAAFGTAVRCCSARRCPPTQRLLDPAARQHCRPPFPRPSAPPPPRPSRCAGAPPAGRPPPPQTRAPHTCLPTAMERGGAGRAQAAQGVEERQRWSSCALREGRGGAEQGAGAQQCCRHSAPGRTAGVPYPAALTRCHSTPPCRPTTLPGPRTHVRQVGHPRGLLLLGGADVHQQVAALRHQRVKGGAGQDVACGRGGWGRPSRELWP